MECAYNEEVTKLKQQVEEGRKVEEIMKK